MCNFSKILNPRNIDKSISDIRIRFRFPFESSFWISVSGCKLTILPDIRPANRLVIISGRHKGRPADCTKRRSGGLQKRAGCAAEKGSPPARLNVQPAGPP